MAKQKQAPAQSRSPERSTGLTVVDRAGSAVLQLIVREVTRRDGRIVALKSGGARIQLSHRRKEFAFWDGKGDEPPTVTITADGYRALNAVASISVMTPPSITIPGLGKVANPYAILSKETGAFRGGWVRKVAIAPGPLGNLVVVDRTLYLTLAEYLNEDLIRIANRNPQAACWGSQAMSPASTIADNIREANQQRREAAKGGKDKEWNLNYVVSEADIAIAVNRLKRGQWAFALIDEVYGQGIWFDRQAPAVIKAYTTFAQKGKFGIRQVESICERNVLRAHPLMPSISLSSDDIVDVFAEPLPEEVAQAKAEGKKAPQRRLVDKVVDVPVFWCVTEQNEDAIRDLVEDFERGLRTASYTEIEPEKGRTPLRARREDADEVAQDDDRPKEEEETVDDVDFQDRSREDGRSASSDAQGELLAEIRTAEDIVGAEAYEEVRKKFPGLLKGLLAAKEEDLRSYLKALNNAANARAARPAKPKK